MVKIEIDVYQDVDTFYSKIAELRGMTREALIAEILRKKMQAINNQVLVEALYR